MAEIALELNERFSHPGGALGQDIMGELQSILSLHSISPQELFYKWESYSIKMGADETIMDFKTARDFKKDIQESLERESHTKMRVRGNERRSIGSTPRSTTKNGVDLFGNIDGVVPNTPGTPLAGVNGNAVKRKNDFKTPSAKANKLTANSSPSDTKTPIKAKAAIGAQEAPFSERLNPGQVIESLNEHITLPDPPAAPFAQQRFKLKANTELGKFGYKTTAMKLSEASEVLDDRIDEFLSFVQAHHGFEDNAFGNPAAQSTSEIIAVGRIAGDAGDGKLTPSAIVLETSRRMGAGLRVQLKLESVPWYDFFPGKVVALRGNNPSGEYFTVSEVLDMPLLPPAATLPSDLETFNSRLLAGADPNDTPTPHPLSILVSSGPYTTDSNLDFEALHALIDSAISTTADCLILIGPFLDTEHPRVASGNIPLPITTPALNPDTVTLIDVFRSLIVQPLHRLVQAVPSIAVILVPSVRDAILRHVAWPQERMPRKELGLPKQCNVVTNPVTLSINEIVVGISAHDVLYELRCEECTHGNLPPESQNLLARLSRHLIEQRHFFPLYPPTDRANLPKPGAVFDGVQTKATGAMLDLSYMKLGEWLLRPDVLVTPSALAPFAKVVESVLVVNPGPLSKRKGAGTYAQMTIKAADVERGESGEMVGNRVYERARVDVLRI